MRRFFAGINGLFERNRRLAIGGGAAILCIAALMCDLITARRETGVSIPLFTESVTANPASRAVVAIATSADKGLPSPVPITEGKVTYAQVNAVVRRALDLDTSETNLRKVMKPSDWVIVKLNLVRAPMRDSDGKRRNESFWNGGEGHWGDITDARVVKSVVGYLIEKVGPRRISLVEGATWPTAGKRDRGPQYKNSYDEDGWTVRWEGFDNISLKEMCEEFTRSQNRTVVDYIDLNDDSYRFAPVPGGAFQHENAKFRGGKFGYGALQPGTGKPREGYYMPETMLGPNKLVNIPAMKMNAGGGTLIFKNYVGAFASIPYGDGLGKSQMDRYGFAHGMVDIFSYKPASYAVIAGFWASEKDWPTQTLNLHHNIVIAGGNPVAVEATALRAMGVNPAEVIQTHLARAKGFGSWEEKDITVAGTPVRAVRRNFIKHSVFNGIGFQNYLMNGPWKETDLDRDLLGGEANAHPSDGDITAGKRWWVFKHPFGFPEAYVSLNENVKEDLTNTITYAYLRLASPARQEGTFTFGFDDGARVYLNGKVIFRDNGPHEYAIREIAVPVILEKGENHLLIKLKNRFGNAGFASSIEDSSKTMLYDLEVVVPREKGMAAPVKG
jgi:hypothetical protein